MLNVKLHAQSNTSSEYQSWDLMPVSKASESLQDATSLYYLFLLDKAKFTIKAWMPFHEKFHFLLEGSQL